MANEYAVIRGATAAETFFAANDVVSISLSGGAMLATRGGGSAGSRFVYRLCRPDEVPEFGLVAKNINAQMSLETHVRKGSTLSTQFLSTTKDKFVAFDWAMRQPDKAGAIVKIDLSKIKTRYWDFTNSTTLNTCLKSPVTKNFASASKELVIEKQIPAEAIVEIMRIVK